MRRTASEMLNELEQRISYLERTAASFDSRREPRKSGARSLMDMVTDAEDLLEIAKRAGFRGAKIQYRGDEPVVVLDRGFYVFFDDRGYEIEYPTGGTTFTYKFGDVKTMVQSHGGGFGGEDDLVSEIEMTPSFDDVYTMLTADGGWMGERWMRRGDGLFAGGAFTMTVKLTPRGIKFMVKGPVLEIPKGEVRGMVSGESRMEQLASLADRLDAIAQKAGKRRASSRKYILKLLKDYR